MNEYWCGEVGHAEAEGGNRWLDCRSRAAAATAFSSAGFSSLVIFSPPPGALLVFSQFSTPSPSCRSLSVTGRCLATAIPTGILLFLLKSSGDDVTVSHLVTMVVDTRVTSLLLVSMTSPSLLRNDVLLFKEETPLLLLLLPEAPEKNESLVGEKGPPPINELQPLLAVLSLRL